MILVRFAYFLASTRLTRAAYWLLKSVLQLLLPILLLGDYRFFCRALLYGRRGTTHIPACSWFALREQSKKGEPARDRYSIWLVTFRIRHIQAKCIVATTVCMCLSSCLSRAAFYYCADPDVTFVNARGCPPLVVHYLVDLQSIHEFHRYGNICA